LCKERKKDFKCNYFDVQCILNGKPCLRWYFAKFFAAAWFLICGVLFPFLIGKPNQQSSALTGGWYGRSRKYEVTKRGKGCGGKGFN
jgi:hypothetical protein